MMVKLTIAVYLVFLFSVGYWCADFKQDGAKLKYCNPKYIKDCYVFTGRRSRREPYRTNMSGITLMPYGNNVTFQLVLQMKSGGDFKLQTKVCDTLKSKWMVEFMNLYSSPAVEHCPFPATKYLYQNMELPPKNVPIPIADGDYNIRMELYITATKESILDIESTLHFDSNNKNNRNIKWSNRTRNG